MNISFSISKNQPAISSSPIHSSPWFTLLVPCIIAYGTSLCLRLLQLPLWQDPALYINGEPLMATHDAYFWLAGAQGTSWDANYGLMWLLRVLHQATSVSFGNIGFYLPAILAPLAGLPLCYLAWRERIPEAGIGAGILGTACLGYFMRTQPGFCDTDPFALFTPALIGTALILWASPFVYSSWFSRKDDPPCHIPSTNTEVLRLSIIPLLLGLVCRLGFWVYFQSNYIILAVLFVCAGVALIRARTDARRYLFFGFLCFYSTAFGGWTGLGTAILLAGLFAALLRISMPSKYMWSVLVLFAFIIFFATGLHPQLAGIAGKIITYAKINPVSSPSNGTAILLPDVYQSIREAQNIELSLLYSHISGNAVIFWAGLIAYTYLVWKKPLFLSFVPLLLLSVLSFKLGNRFTMYGGIVWGIGLCFGLSVGLRSLNITGWKTVAAQILLCLWIVWPLWNVANSMRPHPVLPKTYAQTFQKLSISIPPKARLWQWWDYGYAAQYYAKRMSFADGGIHNGPWLYPLAFVHSTDSPAQAARMIRFTTANQKNAFARNQTISSSKNMVWSEPFYLASPIAGFDALSPAKAQQLVDNMRTQPFEAATQLPPQYFVVSWENLSLAYWISYFGNWDLLTGTAHPGKIQRMKGEMKFDTRKGFIRTINRAVPLDTLDVITPNGPRHLSWPNGKGLHAILNQISREVFVMDKILYRSLMVQMLISPPQQFAPYFKLVLNNYPWERVYKVTDTP